jgi:hypothetical protein
VKKPQVFIPHWVKSFRASVAGQECEVIRIPEGELCPEDADIVVKAKDFPGAPCPECGFEPDETRGYCRACSGPRWGERG